MIQVKKGFEKHDHIVSHEEIIEDTIQYSIHEIFSLARLPVIQEISPKEVPRVEISKDSLYESEVGYDELLDVILFFGLH